MAKVTPRTKAWSAFSKWVRLRDALKTTGSPDYCVCITCNKTYPAFGVGCIQAGHFVPGRRNSVLFDEECTNGQCYGCNCGQGGMWVEYRRIMLVRHGAEKVAEMESRKYLIVKYTRADYAEIKEKYERKYKDLLSDIRQLGHTI